MGSAPSAAASRSGRLRNCDGPLAFGALDGEDKAPGRGHLAGGCALAVQRRDDADRGYRVGLWVVQRAQEGAEGFGDTVVLGVHDDQALAQAEGFGLARSQAVEADWARDGRDRGRGLRLVHSRLVGDERSEHRRLSGGYHARNHQDDNDAERKERSSEEIRVRSQHGRSVRRGAGIRQRVSSRGESWR